MKKITVLLLVLCFWLSMLGQTNLLTNPGAESDNTGWTISGGTLYQVDNSSSEAYLGSKYWVVSNKAITFTQTVDLATNYTAAQLQKLPPIAVGVHFKTRFDCGGILSLKIEQLNATNAVLSTNVVCSNETVLHNLPWTLRSGMFSLFSADVTKIRYTLVAKDDRGWGGYYGPRLDEAFLIVGEKVETTAGGLSSKFTTEQKQAITTLVVTGSINAADFKTMRDEMPNLANVDLSGANIVAYTGPGGTNRTTTTSQTYAANEIPIHAFYNRASVKWITLPVSSTKIGDQAFYLCSNLESVSMPETLATIGIWAFQQTKIPSLTIPASVTTIGVGAFAHCATNVSVAAANSFFTVTDGVLYNSAKTSVYYCPTTKTGNLVLPNTLTSIQQGAFTGTKLTNIVLPRSVASIGDYAFQDCSSLTLSVYNPSVITATGNAFHNATAAITVYVPVGSMSVYKNNTVWNPLVIKEMDIANNPTNKALDFDGVNDYVEVPYNSALNPSVFTVEAWFNCKKLPTAQEPVQSIITSRSPRSGDPSNSGFSVYLNNEGKIGFWSNNATGAGWNEFWCNTTVQINQWYHVAVTYNGSTKTVYLNGGYVGSTTISFIPNVGKPLRIGAGATEGNPQFFFNGKIDEVRIWNTARTATDIKDNMYNSIVNPASNTNLVAYYKFDQGVANGVNTDITTLTDASASKNNGRLNNFALAGGGSNFVPRNGLVVYYPFDGNAKDYSGNGYDSVANTATKTTDRMNGTNKAFSFASQYVASNAPVVYKSVTLSAWVKTSSTATQSIVSKPRNTTQHTLELYLISGEPIFFRGGSGSSVRGVNKVNDDKWHLISGTYNYTTGVYRLYVDGVLQKELTATANVDLPTSTTTELLYIGKGTSTNDWPFIGSIDDVRIYDQPISGDDVADLYRETMPTLSVSTTNNALAFDGDNDYVQITNTSAPSLTDNAAFTIETWFNAASAGALVSKYRSGSYSPFGLFVENVNGAARLFLYLQIGSSGGGKHFTKDFSFNTWNHVAITYAGTTTNKLRMYFNGSLVDSMTVGTPLTLTNSIPMLLGAANNSDGTFISKYKGMLDELRIWNVARTQAQIIDYMNYSIVSPSTTANLNACYEFNQGLAEMDNTSIINIADASSKKYDGILYNFMLSGRSSNWIYGAPLLYNSNTSTLALTKEKGASGVARVTSSTTWTATSNASWLTLTPSTATGNGLLSIAAATANPTTAIRTATVTVSAVGTTPQIITVTQAAGDATLAVSTTNNAVLCDGNNDYISIPDNDAAITASGKFTLETWVYWQPTAKPNDVDFICSKGYEYMELHTGGSAGANGLRFMPVPPFYFDAANVLQANVWTHVAVTYDNATQTAQMFINGNPVKLTRGTTVTTSYSNSLDFNIGRRNKESEPYYFNGALDEFRIWSVVRTQDEIIGSMNQSLSAGTGLVGSYAFNQGVAYGNNASVTSFTNSLSGAAAGTPSGLAMNGTNSNIVPGAPLQNSSTTSSVSLAKTAGSAAYASVASNSSWTATSSASWLTVTPSTGNSNGELTIVAATANPSTTNRTASVVITSGTSTHTISVTQAAADATLAVSTTNNALDFKAGDYVDCGQLSLGSFTFETWINLNQIGGEQVIISNVKDYGTDNSFEFRVDNGGELLLHVMGSGVGQWPEVITKSILTAGQWYHVAVSFDATTLKAKLFVNGAAEGEFTFPSYYANKLLTAQIGKRPMAQANFKGKMDEFRIWNTARPQDSIIANMAKSIATHSDLMASYNCNQGIANGINTKDTTLKTSVGTINGVLKGFTLSGATSNWTTGAPLQYGTATPATINIVRQATTAYAEVTSNTTVTVTSDKTWLTTTYDAATASLALTATANADVNPRTATVKVSSSAGNKSFTVTQAAIPADTTTTDRCVYNPTANAANYVQIPANATAYNFTTNTCSFEFWFKADDLPLRRELFNWKANNNDDFGLFIDANKQLHLYLSTDAQRKANVAANVISTKKWYHTAIVCNNTGITVYLDGVAIINQVIDSYTLTNLKSTAIKLGTNGGGDETFVGKFDEFRIWNTARTSEEILNNMHVRLKEQDNLIGLYHFDEAAGTELFDYSATHNHGALIGAEQKVVSNAQITPLNLVVAPVSSCSLKASWKKLPLATKYVAELSSDAAFTNPTKFSNGDTSVTFGTLSPNTQYYIRIHAERDKEGKIGDTLYANGATLPLPTFTVTQPTTASFGSITVTAPTTRVTYGTTTAPASSSNEISGLKRGTYPVYIRYNDDQTCIVKAVDSAKINAKPLTATATVETTKVYDGTKTAKVTSQLNGVVGTDNVTFKATATYNDSLVGTNKTITVTYSISGTNAGNYIAPQSYTTIGNITARPLTITATASKVYDGTKDALSAVKITALKDTVKGDDVKVVVTSATYNDKDVDKAKTVTLGLSLQGTAKNNYSIVSPVTTSGTITQAPLTVTADDITIFQGTNMPKLTYTYSGFVPGDDSSMIDTDPTIQCSEIGQTKGSFDIIISGALDNNYDITHKNGKLTVTDKKAPSIIKTQLPTSITYGDTVGGMKFALAAQDDNKNSLDGSFAYINGTETINNKVLDAKSYNLRIKFTPKNTDYDTVSFAYSLTVNPAPLTIAVNDTTFKYGTTPSFKYKVKSAFVNKETISILAGTATYSYPTNPNVGTHDVTMSGITAPNYAITFEMGKLTVGRETLTVTAPKIILVQGENIPAYTLQYAGFKYKDTISNLDSIPVVVFTKDDSTVVGVHPITPTAGQSSNYIFDYKSGTLTVIKATITADSATVAFAANTTRTDTVKVTANTKWQFTPSGKSQWLTATLDKDNTLLLTADSNLVNKSRTLQVSLSTLGGFASQTITVSQDAAKLDSANFKELAVLADSLVKNASIGTGHLQFTANDTAVLAKALKTTRAALVTNSTQLQVTATTKQLADSISSYLAKQTKVIFTALRDTIAKDTLWLKTITVGSLPCQYDSAKTATLKEKLKTATAIIDKKTITQDSVGKQIVTLVAARKALESSQVVEADKTLLNTALASADSCSKLERNDYPTDNFTALSLVITQSSSVKQNVCATPAEIDTATAQTNRAIAKFLASKLYRINTDLQQLPFGYDAANKQVKVTANDQWTATSNSEWLHVSLSGKDFAAASTTTKGNRDQSITFIAASNTTTQTRTAEVKFVAGSAWLTVTVTQSAINFIVSTRNVTLAAASGSDAVSIQSEKPWTASSIADWLRVALSNNNFDAASSTVSGEANQLSALRILGQANTTTTARTAEIRILVAGLDPQVIQVTQAAASTQFAVSIAKTELPATAANGAITVNANSNWTVLSSSEWLGVSLSGSDFAQATSTLRFTNNSATTTALWFTAATNTSEQTRTASLSFVSGNQVKDITVTQDAPIVVTQPKDINLVIGQDKPKVLFADIFKYLGTANVSYDVQIENNLIVNTMNVAGGIQLVQGNTGSTNLTITARTAYGTTASVIIPVSVKSGDCMKLTEIVSAIQCAGAKTGRIAVSVTANSGTAPFYYTWSNRDADSIAEGLAAGFYAVTVTDARSCTVVKAFNLADGKSLQVSESITPANCGAKGGAVSVSVSGGTQPYNYLWAGKNVSTNELQDVAAGSYTVLVSDKAGCQALKAIEVPNRNQPSIVLDTIVKSPCGKKLGEIRTHVDGQYDSARWSNKSTNLHITGLAPLSYTLTVFAGACTATKTYEVPYPAMKQPQVALVTIDSAFEKPIVVWLRDKDTNAVAFYDIYRDSKFLVRKNYRDYSVFHDTDTRISLITEPYSYQIKAINACGIETPLSESVSSMYLQANESKINKGYVDIRWKAYKSGLTINKYEIYRFNGSTKTLVAKVTNKDMYTDTTPGIKPRYFVLINLNDTILVDQLKTDTGPFSQSMSNMSEASLVDIEDTYTKPTSDVSLVPNPTSGVVTITFGKAQTATVTLSTLLGHQLMSAQAEEPVQFDCTGYAAGIYLIEITTQSGVITKRLVVE